MYVPYLTRRRIEGLRLVALMGGFLLCFLFSFSQQTPVLIQVDAAKSIGEMKPFCTFFGYDEPNFTTRESGQSLCRCTVAMPAVCITSG